MRSPLLLAVIGVFTFASTAWAQFHSERTTDLSPGAALWIEPGEITVYSRNSGLISGTFTLKKWVGNSRPAGITGGACLVYQNEPKPCGDDDVCRTDGKFGYCITDRSTFDGTSSASCWYKPSPNGEVACQKSPTLDLIENVAYQTPLVSAFPTRPVSWRVLTCQNVAEFGCANGSKEDAILNAGPAWRSDGPANPGQFYPYP
jgi:hypothetical protein